MSEQLASTAFRSVEVGEFQNQEPSKPEFANIPINELVDIDGIFSNLYNQGRIEAGNPYYNVYFRSQLRPNADVALLEELDTKALIGADKAEGFIVYGKGQAEEEGNCMSYCVWDSIENAQKATRQKAHNDAAAIASQVYQWHNLDFMMVAYTPTEGAVIIDHKDYFKSHDI